jgi:predicted nucleic acid-binding Zn ribbon protein
VKVGRLRRYPSTHCKTCGEAVHEAEDVLPAVVAL